MNRLMRSLRAFCREWTAPDTTPGSADERDKALIVSYLASRGERSLFWIKSDMDDHTRGEQDWSYRDDRKVYRLLDQLEAEGVIKQREDMHSGRKYSLVAPADRLMRVK